MASLFVCGPAQTGPTNSATKAETFDEKLGTDDGAALAFLFGANLRGNLFPCD